MAADETIHIEGSAATTGGLSGFTLCGRSPELVTAVAAIQIVEVPGYLCASCLRLFLFDDDEGRRLLRWGES